MLRGASAKPRVLKTLTVKSACPVNMSSKSIANCPLSHRCYASHLHGRFLTVNCKRRPKNGHMTCMEDGHKSTAVAVPSNESGSRVHEVYRTLMPQTPDIKSLGPSRLQRGTTPDQRQKNRSEYALICDPNPNCANIKRHNH